MISHAAPAAANRLHHRLKNLQAQVNRSGDWGVLVCPIAEGLKHPKLLEAAMGCSGHVDDVLRARDFANAAAHLASEAVLMMQQLDEETPPTPGASRALRHAAEAVEDLETLAREGIALGDAYQVAAWALQAAAVALAETRHRQRSTRLVRLVTEPTHPDGPSYAAY